MAKNYSGKKDITGIFMVVAVVIVLALGVYAVYGVMSDKMSAGKYARIQERVSSGEATVEEYADLSGRTTEELIGMYGLSDEDDVNKNTNIMDFADKMTLEKYCEFTGTSYSDEDFAVYKAENELGDDVTKDTKDSEVKNGYALYVYNKEQEAQAAAETTQTAVEPETETDGE